MNTPLILIGTAIASIGLLIGNGRKDLTNEKKTSKTHTNGEAKNVPKVETDESNETNLDSGDGGGDNSAGSGQD